MLSLAEAKPAQPGEVAVNPLGDGDKKGIRRRGEHEGNR
jgi:hypothetical protein